MSYIERKFRHGKAEADSELIAAFLDGRPKTWLNEHFLCFQCSVSAVGVQQIITVDEILANHCDSETKSQNSEPQSVNRLNRETESASGMKGFLVLFYKNISVHDDFI